MGLDVVSRFISKLLLSGLLVLISLSSATAKEFECRHISEIMGFIESKHVINMFPEKKAEKFNENRLAKLLLEDHRVTQGMDLQRIKIGNWFLPMRLFLQTQDVEWFNKEMGASPDILRKEIFETKTCTSLINLHRAYLRALDRFKRVIELEALIADPEKQKAITEKALQILPTFETSEISKVEHLGERFFSFVKDNEDMKERFVYYLAYLIQSRTNEKSGMDQAEAIEYTFQSLKYMFTPEKVMTEGQLLSSILEIFSGSIDAHSKYLDHKTHEFMRSRISGGISFAGIGIEIAPRVKGVWVAGLIENGPAAKQKLLVGGKGIDGEPYGDIILRIIESDVVVTGFDTFANLKAKYEGGTRFLAEPVKQSDGRLKYAIVERSKEVIELGGLPFDDIPDLLKGPPDSEIIVEVLRKGEKDPIRLTLKRGYVQTKEEAPMTFTYINPGDAMEGKILKIDIDSFSQAIPELMVDEIMKIHNEKINVRGILVDVRDNPGGSLDAAAMFNNVFHPLVPVVYDYNHSTNEAHAYRYPSHLLAPLMPIYYPVVVMINEKSASASEVVAGFFQSYQRGVVVGGKQSWGKGSIQSMGQTRASDAPGAISMTESFYYLPNGEAIHSKGIIPDFKIQNRELSKCTMQANLSNNMGTPPNVDLSKVQRLDKPSIGQQIFFWNRTNPDNPTLESGPFFNTDEAWVGLFDMSKYPVPLQWKADEIVHAENLYYGEEDWNNIKSSIQESFSKIMASQPVFKSFKKDTCEMDYEDYKVELDREEKISIAILKAMIPIHDKWEKEQFESAQELVEEAQAANQK